MNPEDLIGKVPWMTKDGFFDPSKFPIDSVLTQALDADLGKFRSAVTMLQSMCDHGRQEAGIFLLGLLLASDDNLERRGLIRRPYRIHEANKPVMLFHIQEERIYAYSYVGYRETLSKRSQAMLEKEYEKAQAENRIVVFVRDEATRRLASFLLDYE